MRAARVCLTYAVVLGLAACTGGGGGEGSSSVTPTVSPTAHPSSSTSSSSAGGSPSSESSSAAGAVVVPEAARAHTQDGAEAFARFWIETYARDAMVPTSKNLKALSDPACKGCEGYADVLDKYKAQGRRADRDALTIEGVYPTPDAKDPSITECQMLVVEGQKFILDKAGKRVEREAGAKYDLHVGLVWRSSGWIMRKLGATKS